ncbi:MAG TPA: hypothetical protein VF759_12155 [Allosphingosinicella sp.]|jgi:hypothetical protein
MDAIVSEATEPRDRVEALHGQLTDLLDALDEAQLHGPAAYVAMAVDTILRDYPQLSAIR